MRIQLSNNLNQAHTHDYMIIGDQNAKIRCHGSYASIGRFMEIRVPFPSEDSTCIFPSNKNTKFLAIFKLNPDPISPWVPLNKALSNENNVFKYFWSIPIPWSSIERVTPLSVAVISK